MSKMGRPELKIEWDKFEFACKLMATKEEICGLLKMSDSTLTRKVKEEYDETFEEALKRLSGEAKVSLRRMQWKSANEGHVAMQIWLGKQYLNQKDRQDVTSDDKPIEGIKVEIVNATKN